MLFSVNRRYIADFDWALLSMVVGLAAFGMLEIWSVQPTPGLWRRQLVGVGIGLVVMFLTTLHDYRRIVNAAPYLYGVGVVLLLLVLTPLGKERRKSMDEILVNAATSPLPPAITSRRCGLDRTEASPKRR